MTENDIRNSIAEQLEEGRAKAMAAVCFMIFFIFETPLFLLTEGLAHFHNIANHLKSSEI